MTKGLSRAGFDIDLREGQAREDALVHVFLNATVEHKRDYKCKTTGNLFIELKQHGRWSGFATSTARWWAFEYDEDSWLIIPKTRLAAMVKAAFVQQKHKLLSGGDHNKYEGVLVPIEWLVRPIKVALYPGMPGGPNQ